MKSEVQKLEGLKRRLNVEVPHDVINAALEKMYKEVQRVASFKGFRPGKAPINLVKTEYKSKVENDVATQIVQEHYEKALSEHKLVPVGYPDIDLDPLTEGQNLKFTATFEVRPDVQLKKYVGLDVEREKMQVPDDAVDQILQDIRTSRAQLVPVFESRPAQMGDVAVIDFHGKVGGADLPNGSGKEHPLELGTHQFIEGFEEGIVGMSPGGNKVLNLKFPEEYHVKEIAGKDVEFTVTVHELKKKKLPELDVEFVKSIGNYETVDQLKEEIKKDVVLKEEKRINDDVKNRILHALVMNNTFEVPSSMVADQKQIIIADVKHRMESQGMPPQQFGEYVKKWDKDFDKSAEFVIRSSLLISSIAKQENLSISEEDFQARIDGYAKQSGIELEKIRAFYSKPDNRSRLRFQMTEEKVMKFLIDKAHVKEVDASKLHKVED